MNTTKIITRVLLLLGGTVSLYTNVRNQAKSLNDTNKWNQQSEHSSMY